MIFRSHISFIVVTDIIITSDLTFPFPSSGSFFFSKGRREREVLRNDAYRWELLEFIQWRRFTELFLYTGELDDAIGG